MNFSEFLSMLKGWGESGTREQKIIALGVGPLTTVCELAKAKMVASVVPRGYFEGKFADFLKEKENFDLVSAEVERLSEDTVKLVQVIGSPYPLITLGKLS